MLAGGEMGDDPFAGDVSSIMVKADMIDNFNIGTDE